MSSRAGCAALDGWAPHGDGAGAHPASMGGGLDGLGWSPHRVQVRTAGNRQCPGWSVAVAEVEPAVARSCGFQVGGYLVAVELAVVVAEQRPAEPFVLPVRSNGQPRQVMVWAFVWVVVMHSHVHGDE